MIGWDETIVFYLSEINCNLFKVENNMYVRGTYMEIRKRLPTHPFLTVQNNPVQSGPFSELSLSMGCQTLGRGQDILVQEN